MARLRGPTNPLSVPCDVTQPDILPPGVHSWPGWNMHRTHLLQPLQECTLLWLHLVTSHLCLSFKRMGWALVQVNLPQKHLSSRSTLLSYAHLGTCRGRSNRWRTPAPPYHPGQKVWLSTKDLTLHLDSQKLAWGLIWPSEVHRIMNPSALHLKLLSSLKVHPTFRMSLLKLVSELDVVPLSMRMWPAVPGSLGGVEFQRTVVGPCCYILCDWRLGSFYQDHPDKPGIVPGGAHWGWSTAMIPCLLLLLLLYFSLRGNGWESYS